MKDWGRGGGLRPLTPASHASIVRYMSNRRHIEAARLARLFKALSSPKRVELLRLLGEWCRDGRSCCTAEELSLCLERLGERLGIVKSTVSHHLKELADAGLITLAKRGRHNDFQVNRQALELALGYFDEAASCGAAAVAANGCCGRDGGDSE